MLEVTPFAAVRFDAARFGGDISSLIAPPYDVLDEDDRSDLLKRDARNIVAIDLPHIPPKFAGPAEAYEHAAEALRRRLTDGTLIREKSPAVYIYHQVFTHADRSYTRRMFIARLRLQPFSQGSVLPHERTFGGPKEDRLALMKATKCQLSPIFGLYSDPDDSVGSAFAAIAARSADVTGTLDGVDNRMWAVTDRRTIDGVASLMASKRVYIADGHHRYGTALLYRDYVAAQSGVALPDAHPAQYIMFVLASMDDPGCLILPYHRALADIGLNALLEAWKEGAAPATSDEADVVLYDGLKGTETALRFTNRPVLKSLAPHECDAWHQLDYAYLHRYLIDELLEARLGEDKPAVRYLKSAEDAKKTARDESGVALLMRATPMSHLRAVSEAGGLMPQKSTYFHPKLATGMAINPLA